MDDTIATGYQITSLLLQVGRDLWYILPLIKQLNKVATLWVVWVGGSPWESTM